MGLEGELSLLDFFSVGGLALGLFLCGAASVIATLFSARYRMLTRLDRAIKRGNFELAEGLMPRARAVLESGSGADRERDLLSVEAMEGKMYARQQRFKQATGPLLSAYAASVELGLRREMRQTGSMLLEALAHQNRIDEAQLLVKDLQAMGFTADLDALARHVLDNAASVPCEPAGTTSSRSR